MDGRGEKVNSVESVTSIPATVFLQHGTKVTDMNLCSLRGHSHITYAKKITFFEPPVALRTFFRPLRCVRTKLLYPPISNCHALPNLLSGI